MKVLVQQGAGLGFLSGRRKRDRTLNEFLGDVVEQDMKDVTGLITARHDAAVKRLSGARAGPTLYRLLKVRNAKTIIEHPRGGEQAVIMNVAGDVAAQDAADAIGYPEYKTDSSGNPAPPRLPQRDNASVTQALVLTGFGFSLPVGSVVTGVSVSVRRRQSFPRGAVSNVADSVGKLWQGVAVGTYKAAVGAWPDASAFAVYAGAPQSDWGTSALTETEVNASTFGFALAVAGSGGPYALPVPDGQDAPPSGYVDFVEMTVTYLVGGGPVIGGQGLVNDRILGGMVIN